MRNLFKKIAIILTLVMALTLCFAFAGCGDKDDTSDPAPTPCETHSWEFVSSTATCINDGVETYKCSVCGETGTKNVKKTGTHNFVGNTCKDCNILKQPIELSGVDWYKVSGASDWFSVKGNAKNISTLRLNRIKLYCYLYNSKDEIVGKDDINLVLSTQYIEPSENVGISFLVRNVTLEWNYYVIKIEVPTLDSYELKFQK